jgi:integrase
MARKEGRKFRDARDIAKLIAAAEVSGGDIWAPEDVNTRGDGRLYIRAMPSGRALGYWRYTAPDGSTPWVELGPYTERKRAGAYTLSELRAACRPYIDLYHRVESRDVLAFLKRETERKAAEEKAKQEAEAAARKADADAHLVTFESLLTTYATHLESNGKGAARDVRNLTKNHLTAAHPHIASSPAASVTPAQASTIVRSLVEAGKGRSAGKLRSYGRAAYALAARAELDPSVPAAFLRFRVTWNPFAPVPALPQFNKTRDRALAEPELRAYWRALNDAPESAMRDAQLLCIGLGGQRPEQLLRARVTDVNLHARELTLYDAKGRRQQPRLHLLPIPIALVPVVERCIARAKEQSAECLFCHSGGKQLSAQAMSDHCSRICQSLLSAPESERVVTEPFQLRDMRRTCETSLARTQIASKDIRAQLQSHGLGGVQSRHYDRYDYWQEKVAALEAWNAYLNREPGSNVLSFAA